MIGAELLLADGDRLLEHRDRFRRAAGLVQRDPEVLEAQGGRGVILAELLPPDREGALVERDRLRRSPKLLQLERDVVEEGGDPRRAGGGALLDREGAP